MKKVKSWSNIEKGWEVMPVKYRDKIKNIYLNNKRLKSDGKTFTIGKTLITELPELKIVSGVTYNWTNWKYSQESWSTE